MTCVALTDRALVRIAGNDAETLLQDVISCDVKGLAEGVARLGALLTPQGKVMFEFLVSREGENGFLFDMDAGEVKPFMQRMTMYRLRAKADIAAVEPRAIAACWDCSPDDTLIADERFRAGPAVFRRYGPGPEAAGSMDDYARLRIEAGVAEAGMDYSPSEAFPHDVLMDLNHGVSMDKGCFVGQEVVSRMQHRGTARRRIAQVVGVEPLPVTGTSLTANQRAVGQLGTVAGARGLALVRIDRVAKALADGVPLMAGEVAVTATLPSWTGLDFPATEAEGQS